MKYAVDEQEAEEIRRSASLGRGTRSEPYDGGESGRDAEITLGMRSLLGIFFGLVLICGLFFGLGYSIGRGSSHAGLASEASPSSLTPTAMPKPSADQGLGAASSPDAQPAAATQDSAAAPAVTTPAAVPSAAAQPPVVEQTAASPASTPQPKSVSAAEQPAAEQSAAPAAARAATPATSQMGTFMVQIAAVRLQQDATGLVGSLRNHGYKAVVRNVPQDSLLHVQIGPFATRTEAMEMRARLLADGYNAVVK